MKISNKGTQQEKRDGSVQQAFRIDNIIQKIKTNTPKEIQAYIQDNVNTVSEVKELLIKMIVIIQQLLKNDPRL